MMDVSGGRISMGAEGTCPRCKTSDATQKVSVITHSFAGALTPGEFEAISFSRARGEITDWAAPHAGSWEKVIKQIALPDRPKKPWILRMWFSTMRGRFFLVVILFVLSLWIANQVPLPDAARILAPLIITFGIVGSVISFSQQKQKQYDNQLITWGMIKSKWSALRYCARDNTVFIPGEPRIIRPEDVKSYICDLDSM